MSGFLVKIEQAVVHFGAARALAGVDFTLRPGEHWLVLGSNGAGKSTFFRLLRGEIWPDQAGGGRRVFDFGDGAAESPIGVRERMAMVGPESRDWHLRLEKDLSGLGCVLTGFTDSRLPTGEPGPGEEKRARRAMAALGVAHLADVSVRGMSRGQAGLVALARALAPEPRVLILDEFLDSLDRDARAGALEAVDRAAGQGVSILYSAHRTNVLPKALNRCLVLEAGRVRYAGPLDRAGKHLELFGRMRALPGTANHAAGRGAEVLRMEGAGVRVGGRGLVSGVDWRVALGQVWAVFGANGAGKTTLLGLAAGDTAPLPGGRVVRFGQERHDLMALAGRIGRVSSELQAAYPGRATVREAVLSGFFSSLGLFAEPTHGQEREADELIRFAGLAGMEERRMDTLSNGQARRALLARAMAGGPELLLLDEPLAGLDAPARGEIAARVRALAGPSRAVVVVGHDPDELLPETSHVAVMDKGRMAFSGTVDAWREEFKARRP